MGEQKEDETGNRKNFDRQGSNTGLLEEEHARYQLSYVRARFFLRRTLDSVF